MAAMQMIATVGNAAVVNVENFGDMTIEGFIASRYCSENTARTYRNSIRQLLKFFAANGITAPTTADVDAYINTLRTDKSEKTLRLYTTVTKLFFAYLDKHGIYPDVTAEMERLHLKKKTTHNKKALNDAQAKKLLAAVKGEKLIALRDKAIIALALTCGLRTCEISRANVGNFQDAGDYWTLDVQGKGSQKADETVKVAAPVAQMINAYLSKRENVDDAPLFTSTSNNKMWKKNRYGSRLSEQSIGKLIAKYMKLAGVKSKNISAHSTRHYAAQTAIESGVDIRECKSMLRHNSLNTTLIYLEDIALKKRRAELAVAASLFGGVA